MNHEQQNLFQESDIQDDAEAIDISAMAEHIAKNARFSGAPDRTSEAAQDQGWGLVSTEQSPAAAPTSKGRPTVSRNSLSSRGKMMADKEPDREHDITYHDPIALTPEEIASGKEGVAQVRAQMNEPKYRSRGRGPGR
jgi:hypothetical protein